MSRPRRSRWLPLLPAVAAVTSLGLAVKPALIDNVAPHNFGVVEEGKVYRAGQLTPAAFDALHRKYRFKTIVDLGSYEPNSVGDRRNQRLADALGLARFRFDLAGDATGNPNWYVYALRLMADPQRQPVLVHCGAGSERTGCVVILYNKLVHGATIEDGLKASRDFGHDERRNPRLAEVLAAHGDAILNAVCDGPATLVSGVPPIPPPAVCSCDRDSHPDRSALGAP